MIDGLLDHLERVPPLLVKRLISGILWEGTPQSGVLALTFDDGPDPSVTPQVLDVLAEAGARATFFLTGERAEVHPELVREIVCRGHLVGSHLMHHRSVILSGQAAVARELAEAADVIGRAAGVVPRFVRPPYGLFDSAVVKAVQKRDDVLVLWTALAGDYRALQPSRIVENVEPFIRPGAILVFHDTQAGGGAALPGIVRDVISRAAGAGLCLDGVDRFRPPPEPEVIDG
jgi:peptidoglycan/xylan/chitin deacetylase (PgdA/CDA1 family)